MLEKYFKEEEWEEFIQFFEEGKCKYDMLEDFNKLKNNLNNNKILALIIWELIGSKYANNWIQKPIDALGYMCPIDCINDANLIKRLKVLLMRLPC